jgi:hypothetical protein
MCHPSLQFQCMGQWTNCVNPLFWIVGFQTIETLNSSDWLLLHSLPTSITQHTPFITNFNHPAYSIHYQLQSPSILHSLPTSITQHSSSHFSIRLSPTLPTNVVIQSIRCATLNMIFSTISFENDPQSSPTIF